MIPPFVEVTNLRTFSRELKKIDSEGEWTKDLRRVNKSIADLVLHRSQDRARGVSPQAALAAESLKSRNQASAAVIALGGATRPGVFALGAEFGSNRYHQFMPWRGSSAGAGYFLYPTIRQSQSEIVDQYGQEVDHITKAAFP